MLEYVTSFSSRKKQLQRFLILLISQMPILNLFPAMTEWFSSNGCYACRLLMKAFEKLIFAEFIFILALGMLPHLSLVTL